jgi:cardiolipin synthase
MVAIADALTLSRLAFAGLVWLEPARPEYVFGLMVLAGITDILDGWVVRRAGAMPAAGRWLDPLCDKAFMISVLAAVGVAYHPPAYVYPLVLAREILILPPLVLGLRTGMPLNLSSNILGKAATVAQFLAVCAVLFGTAVLPAALLSGTVGVAAAAVYITRNASGSRMSA